ncbi:MAG: sensor histidine kinase [Alphaproteobacteria bacterium HGW-Alphaproteobacteria-14]|nr:MAG: sensor histidine kinase [Alphaproteobacteria bacterium HGW-Alphaproteobacteria-14]
MNTIDRHDNLQGTCGLTDAHDRLLSADEQLTELQERCGGDLPGTLAIPELLELVRQSRRMGLRIARSFNAFDGDAMISGFARIHPLTEADGGGCEVLIDNWQRSALAPPSNSEFAEKLDAIDRATAEVTARLDAGQRVQVLSTIAPDAADLQAAATAQPGSVWSDLVNLSTVSHHQPLHWRLLDGANCCFDGSQRHWRIRLIPLGPDAHNPDGFELLLIADEPLITIPSDEEDHADRDDSAPTRLIGTALTPVLRQPIARIIANAETIRARLAGPLREEYSEYAGTIASAGQHLAAMLDDLADLEVVETPGFATAREPVDLADAASRAAGILGVRAQNRDIVIELAGTRGEAVATAEFRRVLQILINLIGNAIAYSPVGSAVRITAGPAGEGRVGVAVADEGPGVTPDQAERIFDKFERLGRDSDGGKDKGSGLGLFISRRLAEAMDGSLSVESAEGGGALFRLELPAQ